MKIGLFMEANQISRLIASNSSLSMICVPVDSISSG